MSNATVRGIVHHIEETKSFGQKGFRKRTVVLEQQNGRFSNFIPLEFTNDGCDSVDELKLGDDVTITYRLSGRKWQKDPSAEVKYFLSCEATSYRSLSGNVAVGSSDPNDSFAEAAYEDDDDTPF